MSTLISVTSFGDQVASIHPETKWEMELVEDLATHYAFEPVDKPALGTEESVALIRRMAGMG